MFLSLLLQAQRSGNGNFEAGASIGQACGFLVMAAMTVGGFYVIAKWPSQLPGRFAVGVLLVILPWTGVAIGLYARLTEAEVPIGALLVIPVAWLLWLILYIVARILIRREEKRAASQPPVTPSRRVPFNQPYSAGPQHFAGSSAQAVQVGDDVLDEVPEEIPPPQTAPQKPRLTRETPVFARCKACMGRWKTTAGEAKDLQACPKCGVSPPQIRLQVLE